MTDEVKCCGGAHLRRLQAGRGTRSARSGPAQARNATTMTNGPQHVRESTRRAVCMRGGGLTSDGCSERPPGQGRQQEQQHSPSCKRPPRAAAAGSAHGALAIMWNRLSRGAVPTSSGRVAEARGRPSGSASGATHVPVVRQRVETPWETGLEVLPQEVAVVREWRGGRRGANGLRLLPVVDGRLRLAHDAVHGRDALDRELALRRLACSATARRYNGTNTAYQTCHGGWRTAVRAVRGERATCGNWRQFSHLT